MSEHDLLAPIEKEITLKAHDLLITKANPAGGITYANNAFVRLSGHTEKALLEKSYALLRHPDMPACVFKHLWGLLEMGGEAFAYVMNRTKHGSYYWAFVHITPTMDSESDIVSFHANYRKPKEEAVSVMKGLYAELLAEEKRHSDAQEAVAASYALFMQFLQEKKALYHEFLFSF